MKLYLIIFVSFTAVTGIIRADNTPQCSRDCRIEKCTHLLVKTLRPRLKVGFPKLHVPGLDPLTMDELSVNETIAIAKVRVRFNHIKCDGASNFTIENLRVDSDSYSATAKLVFPRVDVTAFYDTEGSKALHIFPFHIKGKLQATLRNVKVFVESEASPVSRNDEEYLNLDYVSTNVDIGDVDLNLNADNSNPYLEGLPSPSYYMPFLSPVMNKVTADLTRHYAEDVLKHVTPRQAAGLCILTVIMTAVRES